MPKCIETARAIALIDEQAVRALLKELGGDIPAGACFIADFVAAWPQRATRLKSSAKHGEVDAANVVLLSIRNAGAMIGATALCASTAELQQRLAQTHRIDASAVRRLIALGASTCRELTDLANRMGSYFG